MFLQEKANRVLLVAISFSVLLLTGCCGVFKKCEPCISEPGVKAYQVPQKKAKLWITRPITSRLIIAEVPCGTPPLPPCKLPKTERPTSATEKRVLNSSSIFTNDFKVIVRVDSSEQEITSEQKITKITYEIKATFKTPSDSPGVKVYPVLHEKAKVWISRPDSISRIIVEVTCGAPPLSPCKPPTEQPKEILTSAPEEILTSAADSRFRDSSKILADDFKVVVTVDSSKQEITYYIRATFKMPSSK